MKKERIIEELARLDGNTKEFISIEYIEDANWHIGTEADGYKTVLDDYLEDHNAIQRIVDGLSCTQSARFTGNMIAVVVKGEEIDYWQEIALLLLKATCPQKAEALLRMAGKWEEDDAR